MQAPVITPAPYSRMGGGRVAEIALAGLLVLALGARASPSAAAAGAQQTVNAQCVASGVRNIRCERVWVWPGSVEPPRGGIDIRQGSGRSLSGRWSARSRTWALEGFVRLSSTTARAPVATSTLYLEDVGPSG